MERYFFVSVNIQNLTYSGNANITSIGTTFPTKKSIKDCIIQDHLKKNRVIISEDICILNVFEFKSKEDYLNYRKDE